MPKVSVIMPIYNVEKYLDEALESVKRQTLKDIEIVCVNDGSTDSSLEIIQKYAEGDPRFVIIDKENGGYGKAMNAGMDKATSEYIGILEPDDFIPLNMFEDLYEAAAKNDLDIVKGDFYCFTRDEKTGNMWMEYNHLDQSGEIYNKVFDSSSEPEALRYLMNTWSGIYRKEFLEKHHIRHNETPGAAFQDNGFFFQTFVHAKRVMFVDRPYYRYRKDNPNSSVNNRQKVYCSNIEYDFIRDVLMKEPEIWERFKYHYYVKRWHNNLFTLSRIGDGFKKEYIERISREFKRADQLGELSEAAFQRHEWDQIRFLINSPEDFYYKYYLKSAKTRKLEKRVKELENSTTFKVGKIVMFIPVSIKKAVKKLFRKGKR